MLPVSGLDNLKRVPVWAPWPEGACASNLAQYGKRGEGSFFDAWRAGTRRGQRVGFPGRARSLAP